ncbi:MAG: hypothetical protein C5B57_02675 [Blastocatellia bacterium]|nr:MAG: hypothetical protein C5B57_02675 [Blastocatellia bacterium]
MQNAKGQRRGFQNPTVSNDGLNRISRGSLCIMHSAFLAALTVVLALPVGESRLAAEIPSPESHFGFRMGSDGQLADASAIERYFELVAERSDRVRLVEVGPTTEGHRTIAAIISAAENLGNLNQIRRTNQRLADPRLLSPEEARLAVGTHKAILAIGCSIHASEIGATQAANELLFTLATATDPHTLHVLQNVVIILIPLLNPDGHRLAVDWFLKTKGTPYDGAPIPWLYHKYAGHDINRDAFMMNMVESRNLARFFYDEWHPQVFLSMHQMGSNGPRMFVPPVSDPIDRNYDPLIWREAALLGSAMALELQRDGRAGVVSNVMYDYYSPGYEDSAPIGHNVVCLLTEVASAHPEPPGTDASGSVRNGLTEAPQINYPDPWRGGRWTSRDIVDYDLSAVRGLLGAVAAYREAILSNFYEMGRRAVEQGQRGGPFAFIVPPGQHDPHATAKLEQLLLQGRIEISRALKPFRAGNTVHPAGSDIILLAQPYRAYVKTLLERQDYPAGNHSSASGPLERPYDVAGWTLPAQMGVGVHTIDKPFELPPISRLTTATIAPANVGGDSRPAAYLIDARGNGGAIAINRLLAAGVNPSWISSTMEVNGYKYPAGSLLAPNVTSARTVVERIASDLGLRVDGLKGRLPAAGTPIVAARVGLYKPWAENVDEGWTRWLLEQYAFEYQTVTDAVLRAGNLREGFDAIIVPSASADQLLTGNRTGSVPPEYAGGMGEIGAAALKAFVAAGGTLISLDQASAFAIDLFKLPLRDVAHEIGSDEFICPGSILRIELDGTHPLSYGMTPRTSGFFSSSAAYEVTASQEPGEGDAVSRGAIHVIARYGQNDLLVSGWLEGEHIIAGKAAAVEIDYAAGRIVLLGFSTQHRAQPHATFRLLFNSIFTARQPAVR